MNGPDYHEAAIKLIDAALGWIVDSRDVIDGLATLPGKTEGAWQ